MKKSELEKLDKLLSKFFHFDKSPDTQREIKEVQYSVQVHITSYEAWHPSSKKTGEKNVVLQ